jgi:HK97 family phage prohead protease
MKITIRADSITVEGYVNAVERNSKPLNERGVTFIERIAAGTFKRAIERAKDIRIWLNHKANKDLGGIADGNLELEEDNIGLKARAVITDPETIEQARRGNLVGWSFGFEDLPDGVKQLRDEETGLPLRKVTDLVLREVSLLTRDKSPAYAGTLVNVRDDGSTEERSINYSDTYESEIETIEESVSMEQREEPQEEAKDPEPEKAPEVKEVSSEYFARYKNMIDDMRKLVPEK